MVAGVCGGIAEYVNLDPSIVRLIWVLLTLLGGSGIILYLIAWFIVPANPEHIIFPNYTPNAPQYQQPYQQQAPPQQQPPTSNSGGTFVGGIAMICIGSFLLIKHLLGFAWWGFWRFFGTPTIAALMIVFGAVLLFKKKNNS